MAGGAPVLQFIATTMHHKRLMMQQCMGFYLSGRAPRNYGRAACAKSARLAVMNERWLKTIILIYLWVALAEDTLLFLMSWFAPDLWFRVFHATTPASFDIVWLRRSGGQWAAFALAQAITLWRWRKEPVWLAVTAGIRFSDLFTDLSYIVAAPSLTTVGWILLLPPPVLNLVGVVMMLHGYCQAVTESRR